MTGVNPWSFLWYDGHMIILALIVLGLVLGSFVNAFVWRLHEQQKRALQPDKKKRSTTTETDSHNLSILTGRSMCTHCGHELAARDLVPVLSYVWLRGKCRYCHKPIEDTPLAELATPILCVGSYLWWPFDLSASGFSMGRVLFGFWLIVLVCFVILALYDLRWFLLPDKVVVPLSVVAGLDVAVQAVVFGGGWAVITDALWGVACIAGFFYLLYLFSRGTWIGFGDVKLGIALGLLVGGPLPALLLIFIASLLGSVVAVPLMLRGKAKATTHVPFGPFLLAGAVIVMLFGEQITSWYLSLLLIR